MQKQAKRKRLILALSLLTVLLVAIASVALLRVMMPGDEDPYARKDTNSEEGVADTSKQSEVEDDTETPADSTQTPSESTIDPNTVSTVDIVPLEITVSYVKGIGGFEYQVLRTPSGTRYVEFRSPELVGTKCTNDQGGFASILVNPGSSESATLAKTAKIQDTTYGLSLPDADCTANPTSLEQYQKSFSDAFGLLKKMN